MPELPEVETICRGLSNNLIGIKINKVENYRDKLRIPLPYNLADIVCNNIITGITRRSKYILIHLNNNNSLIIHLGMSGRLIIYNNLRHQVLKHDHVIFKLNNNQELVFNDPRRFGLITYTNTNNLEQHPLFINLGIEPLSIDFDDQYLYNILQKRKSAIKIILMNANIIVGIGNIYASESLFMSNISPTRIANLITKDETSKLCSSIKTILLTAIKLGGSSLKDYVNISGNNGLFQNNFKVYNRENQPCYNCNSPVIKILQNGRSSYLCEICQF